MTKKALDPSESQVADIKQSGSEADKVSRRRFLWGGAAAAGGLFLCTSPSASGMDCTILEALRNTFNSEVKTYTEDELAFLVTNGVPNHDTGIFPSPTDPYAIGERVFRYSWPLSPRTNADGPVPIENWRFGIALNGVPFDPVGPTLVSGWTFEVLSFTAAKYLGIDSSHAHVQPYDGPDDVSAPDGQYHYHGFPTGLYFRLLREAQHEQDPPKMILLGFAADGFPIYAPSGPSDPADPLSVEKTLHSSYHLRSGSRELDDPSAPCGEYDGTFVQDYEYQEGFGDLDECNGREGITPEYPGGIYHYFITREFPFVPRMFKGTPLDTTFHHPRPPGEDQTPPELAAYHSECG